MANNITVNWMQVTNFSLSGGGTGLNSATYTNLYNQSSQRSTLDFGAVQAGKVTNVKAVVARFSDASTVSDLQFWLDSTNANASGSQNQNLGGSDWEFNYCVVPQERLNFNIEQDAITEAQKKGYTDGGDAAYIGNGFQMKPIPRTVESVQPNQFSSDGTNAASFSIPSGGTVDSYLIFLDVQTSSNANSGNTEGWYYRMNFLYS